jgi:hypothetical protein
MHIQACRSAIPVTAYRTAPYTKSIVDNGWYLFNPRLAAPFGSDWRDFPLGGENVHWLSLPIEMSGSSSGVRVAQARGHDTL